MAFDNARLYAERAQVARTLRRSLMPALLPAIPGLELASYFRPSDVGSEVGGDFYDVFGGSESCWLVVGDVCGKGAEAAALTGFLRHTTAAYAREGIGPGTVLAQVNRAMLDQDFDGRFATAILACMRSRGSHVEVTVALAGHPPALLVGRRRPAPASWEAAVRCWGCSRRPTSRRPPRCSSRAMRWRCTPTGCPRPTRPCVCSAPKR